MSRRAAVADAWSLAARSSTRSAKPAGASTRRSARRISSFMSVMAWYCSDHLSHLFPQRRQRSLQMALHRRDRHARCRGNLVRRQVFLIPQDHDQPRLVRERRDQTAQPPRQQRVAGVLTRRRLWRGLESQEWMLPAPRVVDAPMGDPAKPEGDVLGRLQPGQVTVQLKKHVLRELFGGGLILEEMKRDAEHHRLMAPHQVLELERNGLAGVSRLRELGCQARATHASRDIYEKEGPSGCREATRGRCRRREGWGLPGQASRRATGSGARCRRPSGSGPSTPAARRAAQT